MAVGFVGDEAVGVEQIGGQAGLRAKIAGEGEDAEREGDGAGAFTFGDGGADGEGFYGGIIKVEIGG